MLAQPFYPIPLTSTAPAWNSCRYSVALMGTLGSTFLYLLRINFSIAIVCMTYDPPENDSLVNQTSAVHSPESFDSFFGSFLGGGLPEWYEDPVCDDDEIEDDANEVVIILFWLF